MKISEQQRKEYLFVAAICAVVFSGFYIAQSVNHSDDLQDVEKVLSISEEKRRAVHREIVQEFDISIKSFSKSVSSRMKSYKAQRRLLDEMIRPINLQDAAYIQENYALANEAIPQLKAEMRGILRLFDEKDAEVRAFLNGRSTSLQNSVMEDWTRMKNTQARAYTRYFTLEDEILNLYSALMQFYYVRQNAIGYDQEANVTVFRNPADEKYAHDVRQAIEVLRQRQVSELRE